MWCPPTANLAIRPLPRRHPRRQALRARQRRHEGFIAAVLAAAPAMVQAELKRPLHIALSYDEEIGCLGAPVMIAELQKRGLTPEHCIVGEPTSMRMVVAHKGIHTFRCAVHGERTFFTHRRRKRREYATKLIVFINNWQAVRDALRHRPDTILPFFHLSVNTIAGGIAGTASSFAWCANLNSDYRNLPRMSPADVTAPIPKPTSQCCSRKCRRWMPPAASTCATAKTCPPCRSRSGFAARFDYAIGGRLKPSESGLCHRRRPIPASRHRHRDLRPRQYRAGAQSR